MDEDFVFVRSPLGVIKISATPKGITEVSFTDNEEPSSVGISGHHAECKKQLEQYFLGTRKKFELEFDLNGTEFQQSVWSELLNIPFGKTQSYQKLSEVLGDVKAIRAVANANAVNPIAIIIPCHRVIGKNHSLTGYAGGIWRKKWLLEKEQGVMQMTLF
ncbi:MAG: methylated-DNA--[protein]-cysteine S-methyltransferase [Bacteroidia bacterium]|nr:methylated-DNA--[protein]-cysteine S-methyltransferase [Bacteroidia bacterium]